MGENEQVVMVVEDGAREAEVEEIVRDAGYSLTYAESLEDIAASCPAGDPTPRAVVVSGNATFSEMEWAKGVASRAKVIFVLRNGDGPPAGDFVDILGKERLLCVHAEDETESRRKAIRRFLQGDGCSWASELDLSEAPGDASAPASDLSRRRDESTARKLLAFVSSLSRLRTIDELLQVALDQYMGFLQCESGSIYLWDEPSQNLVLKVAAGPEKEKRQGVTQHLGEGLAGWVAETREPILVADVRKVPRLQGRRCTRYVDNSCVACPVLYGEHFFGVVCFTMHENREPFGPKDLRLAQILSEKLAATLTQFHLIDDLNRAHTRMAEWCESSETIVLEKEAEVEAMRILSADIIETTPLSVIVYDRDLRVRLANSSAHSTLGAEANGDEGPPLSDRLEIAPEEWVRKLSQVVEEEVHFHLQRVHCRTSNGKALLDIRCSPLHGCGNGVIGGILAIQDVSETVSMEKRLSSAERLALMGKITAQVAHELSNPLDGILRFQNLASRFLDADPSEAKTCLDESRKGLLRMSNILAEMLALARNPTYEQESPSTLTEMLHMAMSQYEARAEEQGVRLDSDIPDDLPLSANSNLCGVFANVIKNGLDAMKEGGTLAVAAFREKGAVRVRIADTGPGVPEAIAEKIFDAFYTTKAADGGTGLGLAWCREILQSLGGDIRLRPSERGATFDILVPMKET